MDNQHRKIAGYRELTQAEIDLMNRIKAKGAELLELQAELVDLLKLHETSKMNAMDQANTGEYRRLRGRSQGRVQPLLCR